MQQPTAQSGNVHAKPHIEAGYDVRPVIRERTILDAVLERWDVRGGEILREDLTEIDARLPADVILHLPAGHGLVIERLVQPAQDVTPLRVVVDDGPNGQQ